MKLLCVVLLIFSVFQYLGAQIISREDEQLMVKYYREGTKALKNGEYKLAETLLWKSIEINANESNFYNYGISKLFLKDTASCCYFLRPIYISGKKDVASMYFQNCATADTLYFSKKFEKLTGKKKARYWTISVTDRYLTYKKVYFYDRRNFGKTGIMPINDLMHIKSSNIVAVYEVYENGDTIYTYTHTPPIMKNRDEFIDFNPYIKQAKRVLKLEKLSVSINLLIDKNGKIKKYDIKFINQELDCREELEKYIESIIKYMPPYEPGRFMDKTVVYREELNLYFW